MKAVQSPQRNRFVREGFTLVELLVAAAILAILTAMLLQILDSSSKVIGQNRSRFFAETRAQAVLGLFDQEIQSGIFRQDLGAFPDGKFKLYTERPAAKGDRSISQVAYRIDPASGALQRATVESKWLNGTTNFSFGTTNLPQLDLAPWREVASGVVALRTTFIGRDGASSTNTFSFNGTNKTIGILMTVATIDERTERELKESSRLETLVNDTLWRKAPPANQTFAQYWEEEILKDSFRNGQPARAVSSLRIAERYVPLPR